MLIELGIVVCPESENLVQGKAAIGVKGNHY